MPELPEVETIKRDLEAEIVGRRFTDVSFLWHGSLKGTSVEAFKQAIVGRKITGVSRRAKNLAIKIEGNQNLLMHMKMTGHLLVEPDTKKIDPKGSWQNGTATLKDPQNQYIRVVFWLSGGKIMAFSDLRKFGYIKLASDEELKKLSKDYGPEPLSSSFSEAYLVDIFGGKKQAIKKTLMDQAKIAGIGNIYADEVLWATKINPETPAGRLTKKEIAHIVETTQRILKQAVVLRGTSSSDYRDAKGEKGMFEKELQAYRRTGLPCSRCQQPIKRITVGGRGTHYCPKCQEKK